jgi:hypothetical protein
MAKLRMKGSISTGRRKNFTQLPDDMQTFINSIGYEEANSIGRDLLQTTADYLPILSGRLRSSGFLFVNGIHEATTHYITGRIPQKWPIVPPNPPQRLALPGYNTFSIDIIFHTPKPYPAVGGYSFDYSRLYVDRISKWFVSGRAGAVAQRANKLLKESINQKAKRIFG